MAIKPKNLVLNLLLVLASLAVFLVLAELAVRGLQYAGLAETLDPEEHKASLKKNRKLNARLVKSDNPVLFLEYDPKNRHINNAGHRGKDITKEKPAGTFRIAVLGDSIAYGYNVKLENTFTSLLQEKFNQAVTQGDFPAINSVQVYNFAVSGYGTRAELELYKTRVRDYKPDLVLLAYTLNDPLPTEMLIKSVASSRKGGERFAKVASQSQFLGWLMQTWNRATRGLRTEINYKAFYQPENWRPTEDSLGELAQRVRADNASLVVVIFPLLLPAEDYPMHAYHRQVADTLGNLEVSYLDLFDTYAQYPPGELQHNREDNTHPNALGHRLAAEKIYGFVKELLPGQAAGKD
jgi:lysophospholipase L1-like esterase